MEVKEAYEESMHRKIDVLKRVRSGGLNCPYRFRKQIMEDDSRGSPYSIRDEQVEITLVVESNHTPLRMLKEKQS